jgi:hypothetical protein
LYKQQINLKEVIEKPYAQYPKIHLLHFVPKGKRTLYGKNIFPNDRIVIWPGWVNPHTEMWEAAENNITKSKYLSFSDDYIKDAISSVEEKPIIINLREDI